MICDLRSFQSAEKLLFMHKGLVQPTTLLQQFMPGMIQGIDVQIFSDHDSSSRLNSQHLFKSLFQAKDLNEPESSHSISGSLEIA